MNEPCPAIDPIDPTRRCALPWNHEPSGVEEMHRFQTKEESECAGSTKPADQQRGPVDPPKSTTGPQVRSPLLSRPRTEKQNSDEYRTPRPLFEKLDRAFGPFTLDVAASPMNHLCAEYLTKKHDAPSLHVGTHRCWNNPPYSRGNLSRFMRWALAEVKRGAPVFCNLVPAYTSERWWQECVERCQLPSRSIFQSRPEGMRFTWRSFDDGVLVGVHFVAGRLAFAEGDQALEDAESARYSSAVVVFRGVPKLDGDQ